MTPRGAGDLALKTRDAARRRAARLMQVSEIIKVVSPDTFERPIYAGNAIQTVKSKTPRRSSPSALDLRRSRRGRAAPRSERRSGG